MADGIKTCEVERSDGTDGQITRVWIEMGDGHTVEFFADDGTVCMVLDNGRATVELDASRPNCRFEQAVNLLRLYL